MTDRRPLSGFVVVRPRIRTRWEARLRVAPAVPRSVRSLVTPEMLVFMLDDTLARLETRLAGLSADGPPRRPHATFRLTHAGCECGLHLMLTYYETGAEALKECLPAATGAARLVILHEFNAMAHEEMAALCGVCRHRGGPNCSLQPAREPLPS
jgi:hypothetical protein